MSIFRPRTLVPNPARRGFLVAAVVPHSSDGGLIEEVINRKTFTPYRGDAPYSRILSPFGPAMKASGTTTRLCWDSDDSKEWQVTRLPETFWGVVAFRYNLEGGGGTAQTDRLMAELRGSEDTLKMDTSGTGDYAGALHFDRADEGSGAIFRSANGILVPGQWYIVAAKFGATEDDVELWVNGERKALAKEGSGFVKQWGRMTLHAGWSVNAMAAAIAYRGAQIPYEAKVDPWFAFRASAPTVFTLPVIVPPPAPIGLAPHFGKFDEETSTEVFLGEENAAEAFEAELLEDGEDPVALSTSIDSGHWMVTLPSQASAKTVAVRIRAEGSAWVEVPGGFEYYDQSAPAPNPAAAPQIAASRTSGPNPFGFVVTGSGTTWTGVARPFHHLAYLWDFGDPTDYLNRVHGPIASHVYETAGTYTVTLRVFRPGFGFGQATTEITVTDAETVFSGKTICFANDGSDFEGKPAGASEVTTEDFDEVLAAAAAGYRCLLRRGDTFTSAGTPAHALSGATILVGAFGATSGAADQLGRYENDPVVTMTGTDSNQFLTPCAAVNGVTFVHLRLRDLGEGSYRWAHGPTSWNFHQDSITFHQCAFEDFYSACLLGDRTVDYVERTGILFSRCYVKSVAYGAYIRGKKSAIAGCYFEDSATHNIRITLGVDFAVHDNLRLAECQDMQRHTIKLHAQSASEATPATRYVSIRGNRIEASNNWVISLGPQNAESDEFVEDVIVDGNGFTHPADRYTQATVEVSAKNVTVRNNYIVDQRDSTEYVAHVLVHRRGEGLGYQPSGLEVYGNSILSRRTGASGYLALIENQGHDGAVVTRGNILYAPSKTPAYVVAAILGSGQSHDGASNLVSATTDPLFTSTTPGSEDLTLQAGSPAIGAGVAFGGLCFDGAGLFRPAEGIDQGAHERGALAYSWPTGWEGPEGNEAPSGPIGTLGVNIHALDELGTSRALVNLCKMAAPFRFWTGSETVVPDPEDLDQDGYPTLLPAGVERAYSVVQADWLDERRVPDAVARGGHVITYEGSGRVDLVLYRSGHTPLVHEDIPSGFAFLNPNGHIKIEIREITPADHPRNFRITEARFAGSPGVSFTPEFLNSLRGFSAIRGPMQWWIDNAYDAAKGALTWAKRTTTSRYTYVGSAAEPHALPWELLVELVNLLGCDLYAIIPYLAADDYVAGMVEVLAGVASGQKVWLEYSNEPFHGPETEGLENCEWFRAQAELLFTFDPEDPVEVLMTQLMAHAHHGIRIFDLVQAHEDFDPAVFQFLATYPSWEPEYLYWLEPVLNYTPDATAWKSYLAGVTTSFYWAAYWLGWSEYSFGIMLDACGGDVDLFATFYLWPTLEAAYSSGARLTAFKDFLTGEGVASGAFYEFGPSPNHPFVLAYSRVEEFFALYRAFTRSDRQRRMMVWLLNRLASWIHEDLPACHYADVGPYRRTRPWGMAEDQLDQAAPRLVALRGFLTLGDPIPSLEPASLDPSFGGLGVELVAEIAWGATPPAAETFFARLNGGAALTTVIEDGAWKITLPSKATGQVGLVEISLDGALWFTVPGGFTYLGEVTPLLPTGLSQPSGVDDQQVTTEVLLALKPEGITEFFARSGATPLTAEIVGEEWRVTLPARRVGLYPVGLRPDSGEVGKTHRVRILTDPLTVPLEISIDESTWIPVPGGFTYTGYPNPATPGAFFGQVYKGPVFEPATAAEVGEDGIWRMTLPAWATEEAVGVQIGLEGMTWTEVPGGFRFIRGMRFLGLAFLATQAARGRIGRRR